MNEQIKIIAQNKRAGYDYFLEDFIECGIELKGSEIKSLRVNKAIIADAYIVIRNGEAYVINMNIPLFKQGGMFNHEPARTRKLLLHKKEIYRIETKAAQKVMTIIPTKLYFKKGRAKLEIALAKGKKKYDKREVERNKEISRNIDKAKKDGVHYQ